MIHPSGTSHAVRLLIDPGSELTLISKELVLSLNLTISNSYIPIVGVGSISAGETAGSISLSLQSIHSAEQVQLHAHILPRLTTELPAVVIPSPSCPHLRNLELADPNFFKPGKIDILVGADAYGRIIKSGLKTGGPTEPVAMQTIFGWIILGPIDGCPTSRPIHTGHLITNAHLHEAISKFWELEEIPSPCEGSLSVEDTECETHFQSTHSRDATGRYTVRLPFRSTAPVLGESRHIAQKCLTRILKRTAQNPELHQLYKEFLTEYESLGHMKRVSFETPSQSSYYLPHHGVLREESTTTKLRVVFNGSSKTSSGFSLNDLLHTGPKLQADIFDVLLYSRRHRFIFTTDIKQMFRQIRVHPEDWDYQRILWTDDNLTPQAFQLTTVTYGTRPAPYLAGRVLKQLVSDEGERFPLALEPFQRGSYVDDICGGADSLDLLNEIAIQVEALCLSGCLPLAKWKSNHPGFFKFASSDLALTASHEFNEFTSKILGLSWKCHPDILTFTGHTTHKAAITKRTILSETAQLFDPLGLISPIIVKAKILMQELWLEKVHWDEPLTPQMIHRWQLFRDELSDLSQLEIPRWINVSSNITELEIHGFCDASQHAMAAVVYVKAKSSHVQSQISLICAKTRVAPLQRLTIPRLELSAAVLLTKLVAHVQKILELEEVPTYLWTDSAVTLAWINSEPMRWKEFIKNRVQVIQQNLPKAVWRFVSGKHNPADCASRGLSPVHLINHPLWWSGPDWLLQPPHQWPRFISQDIDSHVDLELRPVTAHVTMVPPQLPLDQLFTSCSTLTRLLRVTATVFRAISLFKKVPNSQLKISPLNPVDLHAALTHWIRATQQAYFRADLRKISKGQPLARSHAFSRLTARLDSSGLLRVGGRLQNSQLEEDSKHPAILPKDCTLSSLIIADAHARTMHGGTQLTLASVRKRCWIIGGRAPIKSYIQHCLTCARIRGVRAQQRMGQLPTARVSPSLVFEHSGVDYAGPVTLKAYQGRGTRCYKGWIAVFVCFSTSATHLEIVTDYSSEGFLKAFRRFTSRRGICRTLRSDCGTNFKGADVTLKQLFSGISKEALHLQQLMANDGTHWVFNPPGAPHMGGKWEAAVKSVKFHLQRTIADTLLTYEDFSTLLTQVEAVLNSRPLSAISEDPEDISALTPGHFIRGSAINTIPEPDLTAVPASRLSNFQRIQERLQHFWNRWSAECLQSHQSVSKWHTSHNDIKVGSLVLLTDERYPPSKWPLARVTGLHPGRDGLTRVVTIKTATSTLTRPITKLVLLPVSTAEEDSQPSISSSQI